MEEEEVGGRGSPPIAEASLIVPVVGNHNQQCNNINANFEGSSSYLAILYDPLLGTFSMFYFFIRFLIIQIVCIRFVFIFALTSYAIVPLNPMIGLLSAMGAINISVLVNLISRKKAFLHTQRPTMHVTSLPCFILCPFFSWRIIMSPRHILLSPTLP